MSKIKVAVLGATGAVGQVFMWMLSEHPWFDLVYVSASSARVGQEYGHSVHWVIPMEIPQLVRPLRIEAYDIEAMKNRGVQIVFSALPADIAAVREPELKSQGLYVFSNAGAMRYDEQVPILIPEANPKSLELIEQQGYPDSGFIVTNANCVTTGLAIALAPLVPFGINEITLSTYQSVSGAGYPGLSSFDITDNVIPYIAQEEEKIEKEIKKILDIDPEVLVYSVRVPVMFGHLETVWVSFDEQIDPEHVIEAWESSIVEHEGLPSAPTRPVVYSADDTFPQPKYAFWGTPQGMVVYTGRVKKKHNKIGFTLMVNNVVKGAAGGSIQNAEAFVKQYGLI